LHKLSVIGPDGRLRCRVRYPMSDGMERPQRPSTGPDGLAYLAIDLQLVAVNTSDCRILGKHDVSWQQSCDVWHPPLPPAVDGNGTAYLSLGNCVDAVRPNGSLIFRWHSPIIRGSLSQLVLGQDGSLLVSYEKEIDGGYNRVEVWDIHSERAMLDSDFGFNQFHPDPALPLLVEQHNERGSWKSRFFVMSADREMVASDSSWTARQFSNVWQFSADCAKDSKVDALTYDGESTIYVTCHSLDSSHTVVLAVNVMSGKAQLALDGSVVGGTNYQIQ